MIKQDPVYVRRRRVALAAAVALLVVVLLLGWVIISAVTSERSAGATVVGETVRGAEPEPSRSTEKAAPALEPAAEQGEPGASKDTSLVQVQRLTGGLSPKSVVASSTGIVFAQNMMYSHTSTVYDADGARIETISDEVNLKKFGVEGHPGTSKGAPVEMAFSPDGSRAWVSNYAMYGEGFSPEGSDSCPSADGISNSYLYEIDTSSFEITRVVEVGAVPKYVAVTPDGSRVLVTNWCSRDLTVVDAESATVEKTIPLEGDYPRGIAVTPDSTTAFVAMMGDQRTVKVDLASEEVSTFVETGQHPRHLTMAPKGDYLYVTNSGSNSVTKVEVATGKIVADATVGADPRSMTISPDGGALYVVDYDSATVSKVRTDDMELIQTVPTDPVPIGITYEPTKKRVWVACYNGSLIVLDDSRLAP